MVISLIATPAPTAIPVPPTTARTPAPATARIPDVSLAVSETAPPAEMSLFPIRATAELVTSLTPTEPARLKEKPPPL